MCLQEAKNEHPRVRHQAWLALCQLAMDKQDTFLENGKNHDIFMQTWTEVLQNEPSLRAASCALTAFFTIGEAFDSDLMKGYSEQLNLVDLFLNKINNTKFEMIIM